MAKRSEAIELADFALMSIKGKDELSGFLYIMNASRDTTYIYAAARMRKKLAPSAGVAGNPKWSDMELKNLSTCPGKARNKTPTRPKIIERVKLTNLKM
jgi:hypothetical protein